MFFKPLNKFTYTDLIFASKFIKLANRLIKTIITMKNKSITPSRAIPTLKDALRSIGFKEIVSNVYSISPKKLVRERS
jgi:uncharacterized Fe-S cluster-containing MiaB family protein